MAFQLPSNLQRSKGLLAYNAKITINDETKRFESGSKISISATVSNISQETWSPCTIGQHHFRLGNHWYDSSGHMITRDDGRCNIPELLPGESCELILQINTPSQPGSYVLGLDVVQEHVTWFEDAGSQVTKIPVEIEKQCQMNSSAHSSVPIISDQSKDINSQNQVKSDIKTRLIGKVKGKLDRMLNTKKPEFEMHGIKREEVVEILTKSGGRIVKISDDYSAGLDWKSHFYFVSK